MFDVHKLYATDEKLEVEGVDVPLAEGVSIKVAREKNDRFLEVLARVSETRLSEINSLPEEEARKLDRLVMAEVVAETILVDFTGICYKKTPLEYSKENAVKVLLIKDFFDLVMAHARKREMFLLEQETEDTKN